MSTGGLQEAELLPCAAQVRDRDKAVALSERRTRMRSNMAFLEQQEADFKSGGQAGIGKYTKKRGR